MVHLTKSINPVNREWVLEHSTPWKPKTKSFSTQIWHSFFKGHGILAGGSLRTNLALGSALLGSASWGLLISQLPTGKLISS